MHLSGYLLFCWSIVCLSFVSGQQKPRTITIDGGWSPWSTVATPCLRKNLKGILVPVTCGGGQRERKRSCTNPVPQGTRPKQCEGPSSKTEACNTNPCDMDWSDWSPCSADCGRGSKRRYTQCAEEENGPKSSCKEMGLDSQYFEHIIECNTWNKSVCPSPCLGYNCMKFALCQDDSTEEDPKVSCQCQLGRIMNAETEECIKPPAEEATERPIPRLPEHIKLVVSIVVRTASVVLIIFLAVTLFLFASLRIYDHGRVIQMNMEIALILAHITLLIPDMYNVSDLVCKIQSILIHFFFTAAFMFMLLEALHAYSLVAFVVKRNGILSKVQNILLGWGYALANVLIVLGLDFDDYGGLYHCWLQVNKPIMFYVVISLILLVVMTITILEAAGAADYRRIPGCDQQQLLSAKIMQRTNLIIMPLVFVSFIVGAMAEYNQDVALYGTFTAVNVCLGAAIFFFHTTGNEAVREKIGSLYKKK